MKVEITGTEIASIIQEVLNSTPTMAGVKFALHDNYRQENICLEDVSLLLVLDTKDLTPGLVKEAMEEIGC